MNHDQPLHHRALQNSVFKITTTSNTNNKPPTWHLPYPLTGGNTKPDFPGKHLVYLMKESEISRKRENEILSRLGNDILKKLLKIETNCIIILT